ncbi:MAG TPA: RNA polymerase sigma factor [Polyangiaceae bacterium]|nr:RNA polymerase sigma factor [Polyangiaceae bacterium]
MPSFKAVYRDYFDFVWSSGIRLGIERSGMDDLVQDVFMAIHSRLHTVENPQALRSWIYGVVRRTASNHRRSRRTHAGVRADAGDVPEAASLDPTPLEQTERNADRQLVLKLLSELDEPKREIIALVDVHGLAVPEAAEALQIPLNTAYSRLRTARQAFEAALARHEALGTEKP